MNNEQAVEPLTVAGYLRKCIIASGKSITEIEHEMGARHPVRLQLVLEGKMKLHLPVVHRVAQVLGIDPLMLLRVVVHDYMPEMEEALFDAGSLSVLTANERKIIEAYRARVRDDDLELMTFEDPTFVMLVVKRPKS